MTESVPFTVPDGVETCDRGHPWVEENIYRRADQYGRPRRTCRACDRERSRTSKA